MSYIGKIQFNSLGRWALGASLMHGAKTLSNMHGFGVFSLPFHLHALQEVVLPILPSKEEASLSFMTKTFSLISLASEAVLHDNLSNKIPVGRELKMAHACNEMVVLAGFVVAVVGALFARKARNLCIAAVAIHAISYAHRFYYEATWRPDEGPNKQGGLPEGLTDVTALMKGKKSQYLGRKEFSEDVLGVLRAIFETNNPLLIGPAGSGKTEFIHHLACELNEGKIQGFEGWRVYKTNCKELVSNTKYIGELPKKISQIFAHIRGVKAILFIDEIHQALSDGITSSAPDGSIAEGLLTHLTDPNIRVIAATTFDHSVKLKANEPFRQRFYFQPMPRMTGELRQRILDNRLKQLKEKFRNVDVPERYEEDLLACLECMGERGGLRALIALLSVTVEKMARKKCTFKEALQYEAERLLEMHIGVLESRGFSASDDIIEKIKSKATSSSEIGKEFVVLSRMIEKSKVYTGIKSLDVLLDLVTSLTNPR